MHYDLFHSQRHRDLNRIALVLIQPPESRSSHVAELVKRVRGMRASVMTDVDRAVGQLSLRSDRVFPRIDLRVLTAPGDSKNPEAYFEDLAPLTSSVRFLIDLVNVDPADDPDAFLPKYGISHLVNVSVIEAGDGATGVTAFSSVTVQVALKDLRFLLRDVLIDIAMFHSYRSLDRQVTAQPDWQRAFSERKRTFAQRNGLLPKYGSILRNSQYVCFAAAVHQGGGLLNLGSYEAIWARFVQEEIEHLPFESPASNESPLLQIRNSHKHWGELSTDRLAAIVDSLQPGTYVLMNTYKRPRSIDLRRDIAQIFAAAKWKRWLTKVVLWDEYTRYARYYPNIVFFKFVVGKEAP